MRHALAAKLTAAVQPHDLLCHPFYRAWSAGALTRDDLRGYAAQYQHQVDALPALLRAARAHAVDDPAREALDRNLAEELGEVGPGPHAALWRAFASALGDAAPADPLAETCESAQALTRLVASGNVSALAALWTYEMQTARVARTKREGLSAHHGMTGPGLSFFELHEQLDVHHADDLLAALERACEDDPAKLEQATLAAAQAAQAQWRFLDGVERVRAAA